jgi:hypothetical protein
MHRKALRYGVLALFLAATMTSALSATPGSRSPRREAERGFFASAWELVAGLLGGTGSVPADRGLTHFHGANRGGIDPNGSPVPGDSGSDSSVKVQIDPNG